jgi:hypothetical protein
MARHGKRQKLKAEMGPMGAGRKAGFSRQLRIAAFGPERPTARRDCGMRIDRRENSATSRNRIRNCLQITFTRRPMNLKMKANEG